MATATKKVRAARQSARRTGAVSPAALKFLVIEDNGGDYHWAILGDAGESLAQSSTFATYDDAEQAAHVVRDLAGAARFERRAARDRPVSADRPVALAVRRVAARDDVDAERWLDEGGHDSPVRVVK
jgi:uncharacterized protein YegP (UPF0339 family)